MSPRGPQWAAWPRPFYACVSIYLCTHSSFPTSTLVPPGQGPSRRSVRKVREGGRGRPAQPHTHGAPGVPWGSWQPARRRAVGSHCTQSLLLPDLPGPPLPLLDAPNMPVGTPPPPTFQCGQNRVEGPASPASPASPAPAACCSAALTHILAPPLPALTLSAPLPTPCLLSRAAQLSPSGTEHF